jgi:hypothetical protein
LQAFWQAMKALDNGHGGMVLHAVPSLFQWHAQLLLEPKTMTSTPFASRKSDKAARHQPE